MPYSRDLTKWQAVQYNRSDLGEGMVLAFRRPQSQYISVQVALHSLDPKATYKLTYDSTGKTARVKGSDLMKSFIITIPKERGSDLIHYIRAL